MTLSPQEEQRREERAILAQLLLNRPWIVKSEDPDLFLRIRDYYEELRTWFHNACGFTLLKTKELFKLEKVPGVAQPWMGIQQFQKPLDYALFTFCTRFLVNKSETEQFVLSEMVEEVSAQIHLAGVDFSLEETPDRQSLKRVLKKLRELGVLHAIHGDEEEWARSKDEKANILYECTSVATLVLRTFAQDITLVRDMEELGAGVYPDNQEGQNARRRHYVFRRFLQEPYVPDAWFLQKDDRNYVLWQRNYILEQLKTVGLQGSRYREGMLFYAEDGRGETQLFPTARSISDVTLLLAAEIRARQQADTPEFPTTPAGTIELTRADLERVLEAMRQTHETYWSKHDRETTIAELVDQLLHHLSEWGLAVWNGGQQVELTAALGRWSGFYKQQLGEDAM
ncbi:TIGR02678 family protein [Tumebacillus permanentifrigoris]|uniref:Uncharacterized protein (TIGR02678 family) n=1 Tax=Tumebacillus permanentifrigoris TaxID=378543 RepID=A0A316D441_9BACL|nr:TIGR02678 family protein [Tumebacillus permanentifrigoris]PWK04930.1 uncharacterized protein (TIGR02678 family) [Tumebacillus permanentifrigoris]